MNKLTQIEAFADVAEKGSLAPALRCAENYITADITPVMPRHRADAMEKRLSVKLTWRTTCHLTLTGQSTVYAYHYRKGSWFSFPK